MNDLIKWLMGWKEAAGRAARPLPKKPSQPTKTSDAKASARAAERRLLAAKKKKEEAARKEPVGPRRPLLGPRRKFLKKRNP
jgi:hypothetical protein